MNEKTNEELVTESLEALKKQLVKQEKIKKTNSIGSFFRFIMGLLIFGLLVLAICFAVTKVIEKINDQELPHDQDARYENPYEKSLFNAGLELYRGSQVGESVEKLLDNVVTAKTKYSRHTLVVNYKDNDITSTDEITLIKEELDIMTIYQIILDYDEDGYIAKVTIK